MTDEKSKQLEAVARVLASLHGFTVVGKWHGAPLTVASQRGYVCGRGGANTYADSHWAEYLAAAHFVLDYKASVKESKS